MVYMYVHHRTLLFSFCSLIYSMMDQSQWYLWWEHTTHWWSRVHFFTRGSNLQRNAEWWWWCYLVDAGDRN